MPGDVAQADGIFSTTCPAVLWNTVSAASIFQPIPMARSFHRIGRPFHVRWRARCPTWVSPELRPPCGGRKRR
jgi:hypothetical protein